MLPEWKIKRRKEKERLEGVLKGLKLVTQKGLRKQKIQKGKTKGREKQLNGKGLHTFV